jgi:quinol monooxygenase YgiN
MAEPIVFISHFKVKAGKLEGFKQAFQETIKLLEAEKPRTLLQLAYVNEIGTQLTIVHLFGDADSMDIHFQGADQRSNAAYEFIEPDGFEIYGSPSNQVVASMRGETAAAGVSLSVQPTHLGGFIRPMAG